MMPSPDASSNLFPPFGLTRTRTILHPQTPVNKISRQQKKHPKANLHALLADVPRWNDGALRRRDSLLAQILQRDLQHTVRFLPVERGSLERGFDLIAGHPAPVPEDEKVAEAEGWGVDGRSVDDGAVGCGGGGDHKGIGSEIGGEMMKKESTPGTAQGGSASEIGSEPGKRRRKKKRRTNPAETGAAALTASTLARVASDAAGKPVPLPPRVPVPASNGPPSVPLNVLSGSVKQEGSAVPGEDSVQGSKKKKRRKRKATS